MSKTASRLGIAASIGWVLLVSGPIAAEVSDLVEPTGDRKLTNLDLQQLPIGLHRVEPPSKDPNRILVGLHDDFEYLTDWITSLQIMDDEHTDSFFIRWNTEECPSESLEAVSKKLKTIMTSSESVEMVTLIGHRLGGVYLSQFVRLWQPKITTDVHVVAAPLNGTVGVFDEGDCGEILPKRLPATVRFFQWRISAKQHHQYKDLSEDPQEVDIEGSLVISLPETYKGKAVNATSALKIVAERIQAEHVEAAEKRAELENNQ